MKIDKTSLIGKSLEDLVKICEDNNLKNFRAKQLFNWLYRNKVNDFDDFNNLPKELITFLRSEYCIHTLTFIRATKSTSELANKFLFKTQSGALIESVLMNDDDRITLCLSTQVGCALDCKFCATAKMGFKENLNPGEIVDQYLMISQKINKQITNIVFMGMGEPFLNYRNVIKAAHLLHNPNGINMGYKRITISTAGVISKIEKFTKEKEKFKLAISLNGTTNEQRKAIMPITKKNALVDLLDASKKYTEQSNTWLTFEYVLLKECNDSIEDAARLIKLLYDIKKCKLNVIPYNETDGEFQRPEQSKIRSFMSKLRSAPFPVTIRWSKGTDIDAGCGQLAVSDS
ncbi:23S rRNA (adenine(2503)-C(2))-methyltransferase RlmN [bacterium]|nr:23S rRNA (adenine(2503)-C(2))-methyltransferase RlmN [bacterium]